MNFDDIVWSEISQAQEDEYRWSHSYGECKSSELLDAVSDYQSLVWWSNDVNDG